MGTNLVLVQSVVDRPANEVGWHAFRDGGGNLCQNSAKDPDRTTVRKICLLRAALQKLGSRSV